VLLFSRTYLDPELQIMASAAQSPDTLTTESLQSGGQAGEEACTVIPPPYIGIMSNSTVGKECIVR